MLEPITLSWLSGLDIRKQLKPQCASERLQDAGLFLHPTSKGASSGQCLNCRGVEGVQLPNCFLNPPNTLSNYAPGGSAMYYIHKIYITILVELWPSRSSTSAANFSQFKQWFRTYFWRQNPAPPTVVKFTNNIHNANNTEKSSYILYNYNDM